MRREAAPGDGPSARERAGAFGQFELRRSHLTTGPSPYPPGDPRRIRSEVARLQRMSVTAGNADPSTQHAALRTVCAHVETADQARVVAQMLGLLP